ncbi:MAG: helix-turn-helix transcriptional regulator [Clostridia bacterium]|nr:helix-turn-helix transcriptional regulator [Clostridia bacterium]
MKLEDFFMPDDIQYSYFLSERDEMLFSHVHPKFETYFCPGKRKQRSVINGKEYIYDFPCVIISSPYTIHSMSSIEDGQYERMVVYFGDRTLSEFGERIVPIDFLRQSPGYLIELSDSEADELADILRPAMTRSPELSENEKELVFLLFLNRLTDICEKDKITPIGDTDLYIQKVLKYMTENFDAGMTVDSICAKFAVSRSKLDRDFKAFSDSTAHDFLDSCRLNRAKNLLLRDRASNIREVAELCGFQSETYFYSFFKKYTGISPREYRKTNKNVI